MNEKNINYNFSKLAGSIFYCCAEELKPGDIILGNHRDTPDYIFSHLQEGPGAVQWSLIDVRGEVVYQMWDHTAIAVFRLGVDLPRVAVLVWNGHPDSAVSNVPGLQVEVIDADKNLAEPEVHDLNVTLGDVEAIDTFIENQK